MSSDTSTQVAEVLNAPAPPETTSPAAESAQPAATPPSTENTSQPWLEVDSRTKYATKEDAVKGWNELNRTASEARKFKESAEAWGIKDPATIDQLFNELVELRKQQQAAAATPAAGATKTDKATVDKAAAGDRLAYDSLTPEWKAHVDYLNKMGYVTEDKLKPIQDRLAQFEQRDAAAQERVIQAARDNGATILKGFIDRDKLPLDEDDLSEMAVGIEAKIVNSSRDAKDNIIPNSAEDRFLKGDASERSQILEKYYKWYTGVGDKIATAKNASYVAAKTTAQASQPRTMPPGSGPASTERKGPRTEDERKAALSELFSASGMK